MSQHPTPAGKVPLDYALYVREMSNRDLAKKVGVSESEVSRYRRGMRPTEKRAKKIAKTLGLELADLGWAVEEASGV